MLIQTKFSRPQTESFWVQRNIQQLIPEYLVREKKTTLVQAPAGYGKSTLIAQWLEQISAVSVWLSLDLYDNQTSRFWRYFIGAVQHHCPEFGCLAEQLLKGGQFNMIDDVIASLINDLAILDDAHSLVIVLDDFHWINDENILEELDYFIQFLPANVHLVFVSRYWPKLSCFQPRLMLDGHLLTVDQLKFSEEETATLLKNITSLDVGKKNCRSIYHQAEGWVAGMQLLGLQIQRAVQQGDCVEDSITDCLAPQQSGQDVVSSYLFNEAINNLDPEVQHVLSSLAFLPRFCLEQSAAMFQQPAMNAILQEMITRNFFIIPVKGEGGWYRFHDLFRTSLGKLAENNSPEQTLQYQARAVEWLMAHYELEMALNVMLEYQLWDHLPDCLRKALSTYRSTGDYVRVAEAIEKIPETFIARHLDILADYVWSLVNLDRFDIACYYVAIGEKVIQEKTAALTPKEWPLELQKQVLDFYVCRGLSYRLGGDFEAARQNSHTMLRCAQDVQYSQCAKVFLESGLDAHMAGALTAAHHHLDESLSCAMRDKEPYAILVGGACLGMVVFAIFYEGFDTKGRIESVTFLDHRNRVGSQHVRYAYYAGVQPTGYQFDSEFLICDSRRPDSSGAILTRGDDYQIIQGGDIRSRTEHQLTVSRPVQADSLVALFRDQSGQPQLRNLSESPIQFVVYRDGAQYYAAENLGVGQTVAATPVRVSELISKYRNLMRDHAPREESRYSRYATPYVYYYGYSGLEWSNNDGGIVARLPEHLLSSGVDSIFPDRDGQYVAVFNELDLIPNPAPKALYDKYKFHVIVGQN